MNAKKIKQLQGWRGDAALYELDPPLEIDGGFFPHVVVSAVNAPFSGPETYIFKADKDGNVFDMGELDGSFRGERNHAKAIANMGYQIV